MNSLETKPLHGQPARARSWRSGQEAHALIETGRGLDIDSSAS